MMDLISASEGQTMEYIGTTVLDTIGLVIPNVDFQLRERADYLKDYRSIGILSSRTGAAGQINAIDEAVKRTNTEVLSIQLPRDTKGWGGHGNYIVLGAANEADAREAIEIALRYTTYYAGELYISGEGHLELTYSAHAGEALQKFFWCTGRSGLWLCGRVAGCCGHGDCRCMFKSRRCGVAALYGCRSRHKPHK